MKLNVIISVAGLFLLFSNVFSCDHTLNKTKIYVYSITTLEDTYSESIIPSWKIAINEINNNSKILPNHCIELIELEDCQRDKLKALQQASAITRNIAQQSPPNSIVSPIILGPPLSSFSVLTATLFQEYNMAQMSASASSPTLSNYPSAYRLIASNEVQSKIYALLCKHFNWTRINIIYVNNEYGIELKNTIINHTQTGTNVGIHVTSKSYTSGDEQSIQDAATYIKENKLWINILITQSADTYSVIKEFSKYKVTQFPYYYLLRLTPDAEDLNNPEFKQIIQGYINIIPAYPAMITKDQYMTFNADDGPNAEIVHKEATIKDQHLVQEWNKVYITHPLMVYNKRKPHSYSRYGYDALYSLGYFLDFTDRKHGLFNLNDIQYREKIMDEIAKFAQNLSFIGATGNITFDENSDRLYAKKLLGYVDVNGNMKYIGAVTNNLNHSISIPHTIPNTSNMPWPSDFNESTYPHPVSYPDIQTKSATAGYGWFIAINILNFITILIVFALIIAAFCIKNIRNELQKLERSFIISVCSGSILCCISIVWFRLEYYGIDIVKMDCVAPIYLMSIAFTLVFGPILLNGYKIYRDVKHTKNNTKNNTISHDQENAKSFLKKLLLMLFVDVLPFIISLAANDALVSLNWSEIETVQHNEVRYTKYQYQHCQWTAGGAVVFWIVVVYKLVQFIASLLFSIAALLVKYQSKYYIVHPYFFMILGSIGISGVFFIVIIIVLSNEAATRNHDNMATYSGVIQLLIIIIINIVLGCHVGPILYAAWNQTEIQAIAHVDPADPVESTNQTNTGTGIAESSRYSHLNVEDQDVSPILNE